MMSDRRKNVDDVQNLLQPHTGLDSERTTKLYNNWAKSYEKDLELLDYQAPQLALDFLIGNLSGNFKEVQVLDVACGSGLVAKMMFELGFRKFVGVDSSKGMLDLAAETGFYQDLRQALLGTEPLPAQTSSGGFDLVILVGGLGVGFIPVSVVRELCKAARAGGLICMAKGNHTGAAEEEYQKTLDEEVRLMEEEGLWSRVAFKQVDGYMVNPYLKTDKKEKIYISGSLYLYKKSSSV
ncbi:methyltransferase-like protein 27 [Kryptolebias marmoratus]|uniref:Methyltransferase-like protein 27 n=1 Tax=Kryptolebias marmoratus TaxID=37003 RepID=A0A3Q3BQC7_KRYMA|nr:methyltransferase-like protein 27 [Kryptolebias marmoratus]XP_017297203.1 methyltransferase-like protein 27 [Kryptolebias marmoratus]XP_017297204.1 methyltransferase-like protein 27 [Kryptolebias marmoratus]XP_024858760.1 methyltransferase-like protein 27 [Kryptolebias marmoratus]XP_037836410.1 methyltransferase-like protein 27 [Kryptolebias marmoratus]XP_037836411.1 methyltransferase-like protein 27 [Kryptolebias marmoratus]XP_037836412.1 methyltransferase-like protein 27 [Kryptolebias ma